MSEPVKPSAIRLGILSYLLFLLAVPVILYNVELKSLPGVGTFTFFVLLGPFSALWTHGSVFVMGILAMMVLPFWIALLADAPRRPLWALLCAGAWLLAGSFMAVTLT